MKLLFIIFLIFPFLCFSSELPYRIFEPFKNRVIVVVHPSSYEGSKKIDSFINSFIENKDTVIWIKSSAKDKWEYNVLYDYSVYGPGGIVDIYCKESIYLIGGYYRACYRNTVICLLDKNPDLRIIIPIEGVYYNSKRTLKEEINANEFSDSHILGLLDLSSTETLRLYKEKEENMKVKKLITEYSTSIHGLCDLFGITYNPAEKVIFVDKTENYWCESSEEESIFWSESLVSICSEDFENSGFISGGPFTCKSDSKNILVYLVQEEYEKYYMILDLRKKVAL